MVEQTRLNTKEMINLCLLYAGVDTPIRLIGHEVREEYEYIDFVILTERNPRPRHRLRKLMGKWKRVY